jgi:hypothetical protein
MPVHDWTSVDAGTFHAFHTAWITHLSEVLNGGILPPGYYALPEQHGGRLIATVEAPPRVRRKLSAAPSARAMRRTVAVRHVSGHRMVALIEIVSPGNKDRAAHVSELVDKIEAVLWHGVHVLLVELFPPGAADPLGMHGAIWTRFDDEPYRLPADEPLTLASYVAGPAPEAYVDHLSVGSPLPDMPLFLTPDRYVSAPLDSTYQMAWQGLPQFWREMVERGSSQS